MFSGVLNLPLHHSHFGVCLQFLCLPWTEHFLSTALYQPTISSLVCSMNKMAMKIFTTIRFVSTRSVSRQSGNIFPLNITKKKKKEKMPTAALLSARAFQTFTIEQILYWSSYKIIRIMQRRFKMWYEKLLSKQFQLNNEIQFPLIFKLIKNVHSKHMNGKKKLQKCRTVIKTPHQMVPTFTTN